MSKRFAGAGSPFIGLLRRAVVRAIGCGCARRARLMTTTALLALAGLAGELRAQNQISVPFTNGFIGTRASSAGTANNVLTFGTLGIARVFFIQYSSTNQFELQGNDIPGTMRIVRTSGTTLDIPASANWRNSGGTTYLIGILPRPSSPITFTYSGGSIQITDGSVSGGSSVGSYVAAYTGVVLADGESTSGNAAQSQLLTELNAYLATVVSSRPAGPVTVNALATGSTTPTITGTATLAAGENLSVVVDGVQYTTGSTPAVMQGGTDWSLSLASPLAVGTYSVTATVTDADGFTLSDATIGELVIQGQALTIGGSFAANDRLYDGTVAATGTSGGLTLVGVSAPDEVTIAGVTLAFSSAAAASGKTVTITGVTLGGADAARYTVSVAGAPTATASITPRPLTIGGSFAAADKVYDGTTTAAITSNALSLVGVVGSEDVALTGVTAAFASAAVGAARPVTLDGASLTGAAAGNYTLSLAGAPATTASITDATPPSAPRDLAAAPADGGISLTWAAPAAAGCDAVSGYVVDYSTDEGQSWTRVTLATPSPTATQLQGLVNNVAHLVRVAAVNSCGTGAFSATVGPVVPVGPIVDGSGRPASSTPGTASTTTGGVTQPATPEIVQDTIVRIVAGAVTLRLSARDLLGVAIPVDPSRSLDLEHGGRASVDGSGFEPGSFVTVYLYTASGEPLLLGSLEVGSDGAFAAAPPIPGDLAVGAYTLQVNGIDPVAGPRSVGLGVEIAPPPADLVLTSTPDQSSPMVGDTITITLVVTNQGSGPASDVVIPRAFSEPGFTVVRTTPLEGTYDEAAQTWTIGRIEPGARARMLLTVVVRPPAASQGSNP